MRELILNFPIPLLPTLKEFDLKEGKFKFDFERITVYIDEGLKEIQQIVKSEFNHIGFEKVSFDQDYNKCEVTFITNDSIPEALLKRIRQQKFPLQSYALTINLDRIVIYSLDKQGALYGLATLGQLFANNYYKSLSNCEIVDGPDVEKRIISPTMSWYAGFARVGFGMQLWGGSQWKEFIDWCYRRKINALNIVMYGFWPFEFPEYPETILKDIKLKTWSKEINDWQEVSFTHPNITKPFLEEMIHYANLRGIHIYAYIGMNSYSGGFPVIHPETRSVLSNELLENGFINNYDAMCTSREDVRKYLISSVKRIEELGFNGLVFEESEEVQWFCQCDQCQSKYGDLSPNDAKHLVTIELLNEYKRVLKSETLIGIRWLREPPIVKDVHALKEWERKLPKSVKLFWAPGLEDDDKEFIKWVEIFGKDRIWSRNSEGSGFAASLGRIPYIIPDTFPDELKNFAFQHLWNDILQFKGSANLGCTGINGYGFEWYGHEHFFMATSQFGWDAFKLTKDEYLAMASRHLFGEENGARYEKIIRTLPCIHETQISENLPSFPFMPNKYVSEGGRKYLENSADSVSYAIESLQSILNTQNLTKTQLESAQATWIMASRMQEIIWAGIYYNRYIEELQSKDKSTSKLHMFATKSLFHAEENYRLIKENYFDSREHKWTGIAIGEYYIPMVINEYKKVFSKTLGEDFAPDNEVSYIVGGESLPWQWLLEWGPKIANAKPNAIYKDKEI